MTKESTYTANLPGRERHRITTPLKKTRIWGELYRAPDDAARRQGLPGISGRRQRPSG
ncbi:hypothetical protein [Rhizobium yanglingense]